MKNERPLVVALISAFLLLESCGPDEVNSDTAVRGMENMATCLLAWDDADQILLRTELQRIAESARTIVDMESSFELFRT